GSRLRRRSRAVQRSDSRAQRLRVSSPPMPSGAVSRSVAAAGAVIILVLHLAAVRVQLYRALHHDEAEHLHAAWMLTQGRQLYRDFNENHSPFLYALLK